MFSIADVQFFSLLIIIIYQVIKISILYKLLLFITCHWKFMNGNFSLFDIIQYLLLWLWFIDSFLWTSESMQIAFCWMTDNCSIMLLLVTMKTILLLILIKWITFLFIGIVLNSINLLLCSMIYFTYENSFILETNWPVIIIQLILNCSENAQ